MKQNATDLIFDPYGDLILVLCKTRPLSGCSADTKETTQDAHRRIENATKSNTEMPERVQEMEMRVSSRHLTLASRVFRVMFDGNFRERVSPGESQPKVIPLPEDDPEAMVILLGIIHGLTRRVPRRVEPSLLLKIAILIDKYELHEVSEILTDEWFSVNWNSRSYSSIHYSGWIYLCWVFQKRSEFSQTTRLAILKCNSHFEDDGLPFPSRLTSTIEAARVLAFQKIFAHIQGIIDRYMGGKQQCQRDKTCDLVVLGDLIKKLKQKNLFPVPDASTMTMSITELCVFLRSLRFTSLCQINPPPKPSPYAMSPQILCVIDKQLEADIVRLENSISGVDLNFAALTNAEVNLTKQLQALSYSRPYT